MAWSAIFRWHLEREMNSEWKSGMKKNDWMTTLIDQPVWSFHRCRIMIVNVLIVLLGTRFYFLSLEVDISFWWVVFNSWTDISIRCNCQVKQMSLCNINITMLFVSVWCTYHLWHLIKLVQIVLYWNVAVLFLSD